MTIARYTFLPWLRRGIANRIQIAGAGRARAARRLPVTLTAKSDRGRHAAAAGHGQAGRSRRHRRRCNPQQVIRTEPRALVMDFEPNYLAAHRFLRRGFRLALFAARASTAHRIGCRLGSSLVVLKDEEFRRTSEPGRTAAGDRADGRARDAPTLFPPLGQEWAWAHVHLNEALGERRHRPDLGALRARARSQSRRRLRAADLPAQARSQYRLHRVRACRPSRSAARPGSAKTVADADDGSARSWAGPATEFPIYYEWYFRTGVEGDFESLVRALVPRDMDPRVGIRDMDDRAPGLRRAERRQSARWLRRPRRRVACADHSPKGPGAGERLRAATRAVAQCAGRGAGRRARPDPLVAPPIYGCWHAAVERVSATRRRLGEPPEPRSALSRGRRVLARASSARTRSGTCAWRGSRSATSSRINHKIRRAQLATKAVAVGVLADRCGSSRAERATALVAPTFSKVLGSPVTLRALVGASRRAARRVVAGTAQADASARPIARRNCCQRLSATGRDARRHLGLNDGTISAAPPPPAGRRDRRGGQPRHRTACMEPWLLCKWWWLVLRPFARCL